MSCGSRRRGDESLEIIDFNGEDRWSAAEILSRYSAYATEAQVTPRDLSPKEHREGERRWVYPVMEKVIVGIEAGDPACIRIGIEFIEEDRGFAFGRILKSNTARALRRARLSREQEQRVLRRVFQMLERGNVPREYREYARLARRIGFGVDDLPRIDPSNEYVARYYERFRSALPRGVEGGAPDTMT